MIVQGIALCWIARPGTMFKETSLINMASITADEFTFSHKKKTLESPFHATFEVAPRVCTIFCCLHAIVFWFIVAPTYHYS